MKEFVDFLKSNDIEPIVVINGFNLQKSGSSGTKGGTRIRRRKQNSHVIAEWAIHDKVPPNKAADVPLSTCIMLQDLFDGHGRVGCSSDLH